MTDEEQLLLEEFMAASLALRTDPDLTPEKWAAFVQTWRNVEAVAENLKAVLVLGGMYGWELPEEGA